MVWGRYALHNSGSYCNQNMILDYNQFEPGKPLKNGTFIISEQIPGYVINNDLSQLVQTEGYYGSYNTAYDPYLRQISGAVSECLKRAVEVLASPCHGRRERQPQFLADTSFA